MDLPSSFDTNTYPEGAWWELQWDSEVTATEAWATWVDNEQVAEWTEKYANVFNCDGQNRNSFEAVFPIGAEEFGEFSESGYFHSEVSLCNYENGASSEEAKAFLESYTSAVRDSNYEGTGYHFGNYYGSNNPDADFLWAEFTNSAESTIKSLSYSLGTLNLRSFLSSANSHHATRVPISIMAGRYLSVTNLTLPRILLR